MAAIDSFNGYYGSLQEGERVQLAELRKAQMRDLLAARSEDARLRVVREAIAEARKALKGGKSART